jgi:hypothetical protein
MATHSQALESASPNSSKTVRARPRRYEPEVVYAMADSLKREGLDLRNVRGPWRPILRALRRPGRNAEESMPIVTNGMVEIAVDTAEHAADLSGFLNSAGLDHLNPVPNLRPPHDDLVG